MKPQVRQSRHPPENRGESVSQFPTPQHSPLCNALHQQTTCVANPSPVSPLHLRISSHCEGIEIMRVEKRQEDDVRSYISALQCGSIPPNPNYNISLDPINLPFVPPIEIIIRVKEPIPEWLRFDTSSPSIHRQPSSSDFIPTLGRRQSAPSNLRRQTSYQSKVESKGSTMTGEKLFDAIEKVQTSSTYLNGDCASYYTSPTADLLSDGSVESIMRVGRKGMVRRDLKHMIVYHLKRKDQDRTGLKSYFDMQRSNGCLT